MHFSAVKFLYDECKILRLHSGLGNENAFLVQKSRKFRCHPMRRIKRFCPQRNSIFKKISPVLVVAKEFGAQSGNAVLLFQPLTPRFRKFNVFFKFNILRGFFYVKRLARIYLFKTRR